jgi:hypothetical protein
MPRIEQRINVILRKTPEKLMASVQKLGKEKFNHNSLIFMRFHPYTAYNVQNQAEN